MKLSAKQLAEFRHRVRSELNQILGYAELLCLDQPEAIPFPCVDKLTELQVQTRRILQISQVLFNGDIVESYMLRHRANEEMSGTLQLIETTISSLMNEMPHGHMADLRRIESAFLSLRDVLDEPLVDSPDLKYGFLSYLDVDSPYSASIPADLKISGRLLVVDDSEANRQLLERQLVDLGLQVETVADGATALETLHRHSFDCVLLDMVLPEMNGPAVLQKIRENRDWAGIPVVMLSAMDEISEAARCIEIGAEDYIMRPVERGLLRAKLHSTIQRKYLYQDCARLGQDLEKKNEELRQFVMVASHDLQAPLRTIESNLKTLKDSIESGKREHAAALCGDSSERCLRMRSLIQDLLVYARMGQVKPFVELIELDWVLAEALANLQSEIESSGAEIAGHPLPKIEADFKQMIYLIQNLVGNALRYRGDAIPRIEIGADERPDSWIIYVRDNGIGIEEEQTQKIFEAFHRLHGDAIPGTGLGLAIAKRAVEQAGGRIWVTSSPGEGSTFLFTLPKVT